MGQNRRQQRDYSDHVRKHPSPSVRVALVLAGSGFVVVGLAGIFLPVLPTTPFLLLAAACYARASRRFYNALLNNRLFGPAILEWQQHRAMRLAHQADGARAAVADAGDVDRVLRRKSVAARGAGAGRPGAGRLALPDPVAGCAGRRSGRYPPLGVRRRAAVI